jgi:Lrp/AsnC family transcriptional regulator, leucine-responsive regulatory protein
MDAIDYAILDQLEQNGRIPNNELADRIGLSPSPCLRRVRQLETTGVIERYSVVINRNAVGRAYEPIVWVTLTHITRQSMGDFETAIGSVKEVVEASRMMGQPDYLLRINTRDAESFESLYIDQLAGLPHVQTLTSQLAMKVVKRPN